MFFQLNRRMISLTERKENDNNRMKNESIALGNDFLLQKLGKYERILS